MWAVDGRRIMHAQIRIGLSFVFLTDDFPEFCDGKSQTPIALNGTPVTKSRTRNINTSATSAISLIFAYLFRVAVM